MAVAWGQRKALGKRYAIDPALQMEQDRLAQEYSLIPGREARALTAQQLEYQRQQDEENRKASSKSAMVGTIGNLGTTALLANYLKTGNVIPEFIKNAGSTAVNKVSGLFGKTSPALTTGVSVSPAITSSVAPIESFGITGSTAPASLTGTAGQAGTGMTFTGATPQVAVNPALIDSTATGISAGTTETGSAVAPAVGEGAAAGGTSAGTAGGAAATTVLGYAAPAVIAANYGMPILGRMLGSQTSEDYKKDPSSNMYTQAANITAYEWDRPVEAAAEALHIPVPGRDTLVGKLINPGAAIVEKVCPIIMTAIYGGTSYEANICREYREKYLSKQQLRGYYVFAEPVCFIMEKHPKLKKYFRKYLTEKFVDYSEYKLDKKTKLPKISSYIISILFLKLCTYLGRKVKTYTRINGEVY